MFFGMTVDDVALEHWSKRDNFSHLLEFFTEEKIPATFFVVPVDEVSDKPIGMAFPEYIPLIREAYKKGFQGRRTQL